MARTICAVLICLMGLVFAYAGFQALDIAPGIPLGLGMMCTGLYIAVIGPIACFLR